MGDVAFLNQWLMPDAQLTNLPHRRGRSMHSCGTASACSRPPSSAPIRCAPGVRGVRAQGAQPNVNAVPGAEGFATQIDPAILAEFAHVVYRFGHSMLVDEVDRLDIRLQDDATLTLIEAFLNRGIQ